MKKVFRTFLLFAMLLLPQIASADFIVSVFETGNGNNHHEFKFYSAGTSISDEMTATIDMTRIPYFSGVKDLSKYSFWVGWDGFQNGKSQNVVLTDPLRDGMTYLNGCENSTILYMNIYGTSDQANYYPHYARCETNPRIVSSVDFLDLAGEKCFHLRADNLGANTVSSFTWEYSLDGSTWNTLTTTTESMLVIYTKDFPPSNVYYRVKTLVNGTTYTSYNTAYVQVLVNCTG